MSVIRGIGDEPTIPVLDESRIPVPKLMGDNLKGIPVLEAYHGEGMSPVVQCRAWQTEYAGGIEVLVQSLVLTDTEDLAVVEYRVRVVCKDPPRPELRSPDDPIPPRSL